MGVRQVLVACQRVTDQDCVRPVGVELAGCGVGDADRPQLHPAVELERPVVAELHPVAGHFVRQDAAARPRRAGRTGAIAWTRGHFKSALAGGWANKSGRP